MLRKTLFAVSIVLALSACNGENSITGGNGDLVLSGQVFAVGGLSASSEDAGALAFAAAGNPARNVEIRVRGNGMSTRTDEQGRFSLAGLPATVELNFTRNDGVNATAQVNVQSSPVVTVELQKNQATVIPNGQAKREIEGLIKEISATKIVVNAGPHGTQTAEINGSTVIRKGNQTLNATQLKINDRVHVRALINDDGSLTALEIKLQNPAEDGGGNNTTQLEGPIVSISATRIVVTAAGKGDTAATINGDTKIRKGNTTLKWDELKPGDRVHVKVSGSAGSYVAKEIILQNPA